MRKFLAVAGLLVAVVVGSTPAHAGLKWQWDEVTWRTGTNTSVNQARGWEDSSIVLSGAATQHADTSAAIFMGDYALPGKISVAAIDSVTYMQFSYYPTQSQTTTASLDSISLGGQVSRDAVTWVNWGTPTFVFYAAGLGANTNMLALDADAGYGASHMFKQHYAATGAVVMPASGVAPTPNQLFGFQYIRFIRQSDETGAFTAKVGHWVEK